MKCRSCFFILFLLAGINGRINSQFNFNVIRSLGETNHQIVSASYSSDGSYIITTGSDSSIIVWNAERRTIYRTITGLQGRPNAAVFTPGNEFVLAGGGDNKVSKWDIGVVPPKIVQDFEGFSGPVQSIAVSPDGKYMASGSSGGTIRIWDLTSANLVFDLKGPDKNKDIYSVAFSPDGKILASGGADGNLILWNTSNGIMTASRPGQKVIKHISFSPDGKLIASCGHENDIFVWQLPALSNKIELKGHKDRVLAADFTPDSKYLLSGGWDKNIILWDVASGKIIHKSDKQSNIVTNLDFNPASPDFISSNYQSELIEKWALSGFDEAQWNRLAEPGAVKIQDGSPSASQQTANQNAAANVGQQAGVNSMIEIFAPVPVQGKVVHDKNSITLVGRVSDPQGINTFLVNRNVVKLSEGGVFQYNLNLSKGENQLDLVAINNKGIMNEQKFVVDCIAENAAAAGMEFPEIAKAGYFALLIGINEYQNDEINDLQNPVKDAQNLYNILVSKYTFNQENIIFLKNPTCDEIALTLEDLGKKLSDNDNLLIFYAGHGYYDAKANIGYWLPSDAARYSRIKWFSNTSLRDLLTGIETKHTLLIADACFSGAIFRTRAAFSEIPQGIQKLYEIPSRKAMTSGIFSQEVPDESEFIKWLVRKLDENKENFLPSEILFSNLKPAVMNNSSNIPQYGVIQNVGDAGGGDFIFVHK
jgi:hypothetical protein